MTIDTSREAVERLARDHMTVSDCHKTYVMGHPHHWKTAHVLTALLARAEAAEGKIENAGQAMAETQPSWEYRCHAITAALGMDFGGPTPDGIPEEHTWYSHNLKRANSERDAAVLEAHQYKAERDAALAEVDRLSTPPDDAEMRLFRDRATAIDPLLEVDFDTQRDVEQNPYGAREAIETALHLIRDQAAMITRLSHALAAETAKREAMETALRYYADQFCEGFCDDMPSLEYTDADCERDCGGCKARATLAKHGSK